MSSESKPSISDLIGDAVPRESTIDLMGEEFPESNPSVPPAHALYNPDEWALPSREQFEDPAHPTRPLPQQTQPSEL